MNGLCVKLQLQREERNPSLARSALFQMQFIGYSGRWSYINFKGVLAFSPLHLKVMCRNGRQINHGSPQQQRCSQLYKLPVKH